MNGFYTKVKSFFELKTLFGLSTAIWLITCVKMKAFLSNLRKLVRNNEGAFQNGRICSYGISV